MDAKVLMTLAMLSAAQRDGAMVPLEPDVWFRQELPMMVFT